MKNQGKVLFIVHDVYQEDNLSPLGIGYLAAVLRKNGAEVTIYSQDVYHYSNEELEEFLMKNEFDLIGVGFLAARFKETILDLCKIINECKKSAYLVLGGHGPSPIPEYILKKTKADIVAIGESEETIIELLQSKLSSGKGLSKIKGIAYRQNGHCYINNSRSLIKKLDTIPFPEYSLFPMEKYATCLRLFNHKETDRYAAILTSRGCTNRCNFCYRMEKGIRLRTIENVIDEINILNKEFGINYFLISDELFIISKKRLKDFRDALKSNNLKIKFSCDGRVDLIDEEIIELLKDCGCQFLNFGFESTTQDVLSLMNKRATVEQNQRAAELTKKSGIGMGLNFLWGNKGDNEETLKSNIAFIKKYNTYDQIRTIRPTTPYPGSDLYNEAIEKGLLLGPEDFFEKFKNSDLLTVNFTDIPEKKFYELLFEANKSLILDYFKHTSGDTNECKTLIEIFYNLYFMGDYKFRGARHYNSKGTEKNRIACSISKHE